MSYYVLGVTGPACSILYQLQEQLHQTTESNFDQLGLGQSAVCSLRVKVTDQISYTSLSSSASTLLVPLPHPLEIRRDALERVNEFPKSHNIGSSGENSRLVSGRCCT